MVICNNCGVELEPEMKVCPLCEQPVNSNVADKKNKSGPDETRLMSQPQRKATWEVVSVIVILTMIATSVINVIINKEFSWAEYPVAICLILFSYISVFAFLNKRREVQILSVMISASVLILILDELTDSRNWALYLGIPLIFVTNLTAIGLIRIIKRTRQRGINLLAYSILACALLTVCIEFILNRYLHDLKLMWSLIVCASAVPVSAVLLFMHFKLKKGRDLNRTFHL